MCRHDGCEKVYSQKTNRKRHEKTCSHKKEELSIEKVSVFYCSKSWCSKSFKTKFNCNRHEITCSWPKRRVTQSYLCKKEFSKLSNLKRHLVVHTKPKKKKPLKKPLSLVKLTLLLELIMMTILCLQWFLRTWFSPTMKHW